jgi:hypothetical protein
MLPNENKKIGVISLRHPRTFRFNRLMLSQSTSIATTTVTVNAMTIGIYKILSA